MQIKVKKLREDSILPNISHPGDAGMDLCSVDTVTIQPGQRVLVPCGFAMALPPNTEAQIRPRSGLALKHGISVLNSPGTVDEGYRGQICCILINHGEDAFQIDKGMRIAQMVIKPVLNVGVVEVEDLEDTSRGAGGFGSTGA